MSYGCGNYMCRGDPGFFSNVFRAITHTIGGAITGMISGGPIGAIIGAGTGAVHATASNVGAATLEAGGTGSALTPALRARHAAAVARGVGVMAPGGGVPHHLIHGGKKRRTMNWSNHRALGRAERRIHSAVKHLGRYFRWVHPHRPGHLAPKFGKHRRK